jgi:hypothetical protein
MRMKRQIIRCLLSFYPMDWRTEYGPELEDLLLSRSLNAYVVGDVLWNGLKERARSREVPTLLASAMMLAIFGGLVWNIVSPPPYGYGWRTILQDSSKTWPRVVVAPFQSELYVLLLVFCGCWTYLRDGGNASRSGRTAVKVTFIAGIPVMVAGVLMFLGILSVGTIGPNDQVGSLHEYGFTYTYWNAHHQSPSAVSVLLAPLAALPQCWLWGWVGGKLGQRLSPYLAGRIGAR